MVHFIKPSPDPSLTSLPGEVSLDITKLVVVKSIVAFPGVDVSGSSTIVLPLAGPSKIVSVGS